MLLRYIVSNYKSIGNSIEFSMFPTKNDNDNRFLKTIDTKAGKWKIMQRGGFFGPNASGKSSFIESVYFAQNFVTKAQPSGKSIKIDQFKGEIIELEGISTFQFMFYQNGDVFEYGFSLDKKQVYEEWLMILDETGMIPLFKRATDIEGVTEIDIEEAFYPNDSKTRELADILKNGMKKNQKNQLFLYKMHDNGIEKATAIVEWFKHLQIVFPTSKVRSLPIKMKKNTDFKEFIAQKLKELDTGVFDVTVEETKIDFNEYAERFNLSKEIVEDVEDLKQGVVNINGKYFVFSEDERNRTSMIQIKFNHHLNGKNVSLNLDDESDGTKRLLDLLPMLFIMNEDNDAVFFIDEIDRSLHTTVSQYLLNEFVSKCNISNSQIVFTAHDVNLINLNDFCQDEIWFIEKNRNGESQIKPLSDFNLQNGQNTLKSYLNGRFGAVPVIRRA